jgi:ADP-dependent NAD(P)H-hydrate dehydratase / NAD(P)H-hydrate epimerase
MKIASVEQMRGMDRYAIEKLGITEEILMENAAGAAIDLLQNKMGIYGQKFVIFCGTGNNGGDGLALARLIHSAGGSARVYILGDETKYRGAAKTNYDIIAKLPVS